MGLDAWLDLGLCIASWWDMAEGGIGGKSVVDRSRLSMILAYDRTMDVGRSAINIALIS